MGWYFITKVIKGYSYLYRQRTWREGGKVKCQSQYIGPGNSSRASVGTITVTSAEPDEPQSVPVRKRRVAYHDSREGISGTPKASVSGRYGAGFYVADKAKAELYARYSPKTVSYIVELGEQNLPVEFNGSVYIFDISALNIISVKNPAGYYALIERVLHLEKHTSHSGYNDQLREALLEQGYDGLEIERDQIVIFEPGMHKMRKTRDYN